MTKKFKVKYYEELMSKSQEVFRAHNYATPLELKVESLERELETLKQEFNRFRYMYELLADDN